jgi:hypothetical protein
MMKWTGAIWFNQINLGLIKSSGHKKIPIIADRDFLFELLLDYSGKNLVQVLGLFVVD